ncbi:PD-(D/E)XK nuclease family protein [Cupriavidus necator]
MTAPTVFKVRASSWGSLFDCAYKFEWETLLGKGKAAGVRALLGTALHASTAVNDTALVQGKQVKASDSAGVLVDTLNHPEFDVDYRADDLSVRDAERIGLSLHAMYCALIAPTMGYTDVETALDPMDIDCGGGIIVTLTGRMDRARVSKTASGFVIPDLKSGRAVITQGQANTKGRSAQLGAYQLLYDHTKGVRTSGAQIVALSTTTKPAVAVSPVFDARRVMVGGDGTPGLIEYAADMFRSGLFPPNPQSTLCSKKYCARWDHCHFHE